MNDLHIGDSLLIEIYNFKYMDLTIITGKLYIYRYVKHKSHVKLA